MLCLDRKSEPMKAPQRKMSRALTHPMDTKSNMTNGCQDCQELQDDCLPKFRTPMILLQKTGNSLTKVRVVLSIYSTNYDLYAVVSQDRNIIVKDCGYIKLKQCLVTMDTAEQTLEIIQKKYEGMSLLFKVYKREHLDTISKLLHLNGDNESTELENCLFSSHIPSPLSASPVETSLHPALKKLRTPKCSQVTRSPRGSPLERRKLSMPVLAEDVESENETDSIPEEGEENGFESEE